MIIVMNMPLSFSMPASLCGLSQDTSRLCKSVGATVLLGRTYSDGSTLSRVQGLQIREAPAPSTLVLCLGHGGKPIEGSSLAGELMFPGVTWQELS